MHRPGSRNPLSAAPAHHHTFPMDWIAIISGFGIGAIVGMTGVGGGSLMTPLLIGVFKLNPAVAIGTDLWFAAATKTGGAWAHHRHGHVDDGELAFLKLFVLAQLVLLVVIVSNGYRGVPIALVILGLVAVLVHQLVTNTPFGRYLYAIGGNEEAAAVSGVPVRNTIIGAYAIMGGIVALTGFMQTAYSGASTSTVGSLMELDAVAACVIGGTSLRGGRGTVLGVLFGALIMASLLNGMTLMAVSPEAKYIARGSVLALAVWLDLRLGKGR